jgi:PAS domain S-box-containing protein
MYSPPLGDYAMPDRIRILILEDSRADVDLIEFELEEAGLGVTTRVVTTEDDFVHEIEESCPDLILSDYDLPTYNGASALAEANKRCPDTPFILVTGALVEDRAIEILTHGAKDYVLKNRLQKRLAPAVRRALAEAEERRARKKAEAELREAHRTLEDKVKIRTAELEAEIASRLNTEQALRESEQREHLRAEELATILDAVPTPVIIVHGTDAAHMTGNRTADELLQQPRGAEISLSAPPEMKPRHFKTIKDRRELRLDELPAQRAARGEHVKDFEFSLVFNDGTTRHLLGYGTPLLDEQQQPHGAVHVLVDITERKKMEDALRESEARFRALVTASSEVMYYMSPDWSEMTQLHSRSFLANTEKPNLNWLEEYIPLEDQPEVTAAIHEAIRTKSIFELEHRVWRADGNLGWTFSRAVPMMDENGEIVQWFGTANDITDRKQAEKKLRESESILRAFFDSPGMLRGIVEIADGSIRYVSVNKAVAAAYGLKPDEVCGKPISELGTPPEVVNVYLERCDEARRNGRVVSFEVFRRLADGDKWLLVSASYLGTGPTGSPRFAFVVLDISRRNSISQEK